MSPRDTILRGHATLSEFRRTMQSIGRRALALLVEDAPDDIDLTRRLFARHDIPLDVATTAAAGKDMMLQKEYDIVFLDLVLPDCSGLDVISHAYGHQDKAFFIVLTGINDDNPMIKEALERGAKAAIRKPITDDHLRLIFGSLP